MSYFQERIFKELGATNKDLELNLSVFEPIDGCMQQVTIPAFYEDQNGDIRIPIYSLNRELLTYPHPKADPSVNSSYNNKFQSLEIIRFASPKTYKDEHTGEIRTLKYQYPKGQASKPYFPKLILEAYEKRTEVKTLILTEGYFKSFKACMHGIPCIGLQSISTTKDKTTGAMFADIIKFIEQCSVKNVVMLYDGDCTNISPKALQQGKDLVARPSQFIASATNLRELFKDIEVDFYFAAVNSLAAEGQPKGLDDLLVALNGNENNVAQDLLSLSKPAQYFIRENITRRITKMLNHFGTNNIESFYDLHQEQIGTREFSFKGTKYCYDAIKQKVVPTLRSDLSCFCRIGDEYYEKVLIPNKFGGVDSHLTRRLKGTISDDFGTDAPKRVAKYKAFCNVPNHMQYESVIHDCFNLYNPFTHSFIEGECEASLDFVRHIFGERYEMGLDYIQLLLTKPTEKLPVLCLVSRENKTGKSTFANWLREIFGLNGIFVSSQDFDQGFNFHWAGKLLIMCEETELDKTAVMDRVKTLSTADNITMNRKGKDHEQVDFFAKFILCSNNEERFIKVGSQDQRYWVEKVPVIEKLDPFFEKQLKSEIPHFLAFLQNRKLSYPNKLDRMWFPAEDYRTAAFEKLVAANRSKAESELRHFLHSVFTEFEFCTMHADEPCLLLGADWIRKEFFNQKYDRGYIKFVLEQMHVGFKLNEEGKCLTTRCKVPYWNENSALCDEIATKEHLCKPYVFFAKDYVNDEELTKLRAKYSKKIPF